MLKFRCQHCGQRIAVPPRNLGRLVTCSECGAQTHPLAEQIAGAAPPVAKTASASPPSVRAGACDNCGGPIGKLQTSHAWEGHTVCGACLPRLVGDSNAGPTRAAIDAAPAVALTPSVVRRVPHGDSGAPPAPVQSPAPLGLMLRERVLRALIVFVVASVALYGALSLLRDIAGLIAVAAVGVIALLALYALFRGAVAARRKTARPTDLAPLRHDAA